MKIIDIDALLQTAKTLKVRLSGDRIAEAILIENLVSAPTAEVPVETTHWEFDRGNPGRFKCAACGVSITGDTANGKYVAHNGFFPYPYCPMCGRKAE